MRRSESETFKDLCSIKDWKYDAERFGWDYKLRDKDGDEMTGWFKETNLKKA